MLLAGGLTMVFRTAILRLSNLPDSIGTLPPHRALCVMSVYASCLFTLPLQ